MEYTEIVVPDMNDSVSRIVLDGTEYLIRFTWNEYAERWSFGLYTTQHEPIALGLRVVTKFPLNMQIIDERFPLGAFGVMTNLLSVGRNDFKEGNAAFVYIPA